MTKSLVAVLALVAMLPASGGALGSAPDPFLVPVAPSPPGGAACPAGQVIQPNGESCLPPVSAPVGTVNTLGMTPAEMSRALGPGLPRRVLSPSCAPGQVLQGNGETCVAR